MENKNKESALDIFIENLNADLSWQGKESWIDPHSITVNNLLGHGRNLIFMCS